jgi:hypothetical protein
MTLPVHFATLHGGSQPLSLLDRQFAAVAELTTIPCLAGSNDGNTIVLTPFDNTPTLHRYIDLTPQFIFVAPANNSGPITLNVVGSAPVGETMLTTQSPGAGFPPAPTPMPLGPRPAFKAGGTQPLAAGDIVSGAVYVAVFVLALNSGMGAFAIAPYGDTLGLATQIPLSLWPNWQGWSPTVNSSNGPYGGVTVGGAAYLTFGHLVLFSISLTVTDKGSGGSFMQITLPSATGLPAETCVGSGRNIGTSVMGSVMVAVPENWATYANFDGSDPVAATGATTINMTGFYGV